MKIRKRIAAAAFAAALAAASCVTAAADEKPVTVRLNSIGNSRVQEVWFGDNVPIQINDRTYVHSRSFAEAAGMIVGWEGENNTAFIKIKADASSDKPIEVFAARQFNLLAGRAPGVPSNISVSLMTDNSQAVLRYNYDIGNGNVAGLGKDVEMDGAATIGNYGALMVPMRSIMELLGLTVSWDEETRTADIYIPDKVTVPDGLEATDKWIPDSELYTGNTPPVYIPDDAHEIGQYLGSFKVTKYCPCDICNGGWGAYTAWAGPIIPGQTVGVNLNDGIPKLAWIYIDGYGWRRAEDTGGGIGYHHVDIAVATHYEATHGDVSYHDVWLAK